MWKGGEIENPKIHMPSIKMPETIINKMQEIAAEKNISQSIIWLQAAELFINLYEKMGPGPELKNENQKLKRPKKTAWVNRY